MVAQLFALYTLNVHSVA